MLRTLLTSFVIAFAIQPALLTGKLPKPDRIPEPPTSEQIALIHEGVALHDQGNYIGAILKYKQVLAQNPWEVRALHELAFTYFANKQYQESLDTALRGAQCRSPLLDTFYMDIGDALDELGRNKEAIDTYKDAIKLSPRMALLHYNLALSLRRAGQQAEAKAAVEAALKLDPNHASSHALLGEIYRDMGYRIPAVLAYSRFLVLEPASARSAKRISTLRELIAQGVGKGEKPGSVNIVISEQPKRHNDEGDFTEEELMVSLLAAANLKPKDTEKPRESAYQRLASTYSGLGEILGNSKPTGGFAATYYAPYFAALAKAGHTEAFTAYAWKSANLEGTTDWESKNPGKMEAFLEWSLRYQWPEK